MCIRAVHMQSHWHWRKYFRRLSMKCDKCAGCSQWNTQYPYQLLANRMTFFRNLLIFRNKIVGTGHESHVPISCEDGIFRTNFPHDTRFKRYILICEPDERLKAKRQKQNLFTRLNLYHTILFEFVVGTARSRCECERENFATFFVVVWWSLASFARNLNSSIFSESKERIDVHVFFFLLSVATKI